MNPSFSRRSAFAFLAAGGFVGSPVGAQHAADESASALPVFSRRSDLAKAVPAIETHLVFVAGALRPGIGEALYRRVGREPFHAGKIRSADGSWWEIVPDEIVNVLQFGAVGDGVHDDAAAIQAAFDYAIYVDGAPKRIFLPSLRYLVGDTLHVGYGDRFVTVEVIGAPSLAGAREEPLGLYPRFNDRPCLNVQGGRRVRLRGLTILGVNRNYLRTQYDRFEDRGRRVDWLGPALGPNSDSAHAPYAGIAIDAYSGPPPPIAYPPVEYPSFVGARTQYNKNYSSDTILEDCRIEGFCVAVAVQPGLVPEASNGDFITYRDCSFNFNVVAIADGHPDARCNNIENSRLHFNHTAIDTLTYGPGAGMFIARISGSSFDNVWRILNVDIGGSEVQGGFPLKFDGCYGEGVYHLGRAYAAGAGAPGISFDSCKFEFSVKNKEYSPAALLSCRAGTAVFRNCVLLGGLGFTCFDATVELDGVSSSHLQNEVFDTKTAAGRLAKSFTGGIWANAACRVRLSPNVFFDLSGRSLDFARIEGLDSRAFAVDREAGSDRNGRPIPWWVENLADEQSLFPVGRLPSMTLDRSQGAVEITKPDGIEYELALPRAWLARLEDKGHDAGYLFGAGDTVEDRDGGIFAYVVAAAFPTNSDDIGVKLLRPVDIHVGGEKPRARHL